MPCEHVAPERSRNPSVRSAQEQVWPDARLRPAKRPRPRMYDHVCELVPGILYPQKSHNSHPITEAHHTCIVAPCSFLRGTYSGI